MSEASPPRVRMRTRAAIAAGKTASALSRAAGRGEGMVIGGQVILRLAPDAITELAGGRVAALVSATNGKTSTTKLLATSLEQSGPVVSQPTGANMSTGIVMALSGSQADATVVLEVDEAYLPRTMNQTHPRVVLLGNLSRDQLDRMNEVAMTARSWRRMLADHPDVTVIANADDPMVEYAASQSPSVIWVGAGQTWTSDSSVCAACGSLLSRGGGTWSCPGCGRHRPDPAWQLTDGMAIGPDGERYDLSKLQLPGRFNQANATLALAATQSLGLDPAAGLARMEQVDSVSGRYGSFDVGTLRIKLFLAKNPAGWAELLDVMPAPPTPIIVTINSDFADGRDPSWLWDVPFEKLQGHAVVATGFRRRDLAVRLTQAGVEHVVIKDPYAPGAPIPSSMRDLAVVHCCATYTAFHHLRTTGVPA